MWNVDDAWRTLVRTLTAGKAPSISDAARAGGISQATLSGLLSGKYNHSRAVPKINKFLGIDSVTPDQQRAREILASLKGPDAERWLAFGEALAMSHATAPPQVAEAETVEEKSGEPIPVVNPDVLQQRLAKLDKRVKEAAAERRTPVVTKSRARQEKEVGNRGRNSSSD